LRRAEQGHSLAQNDAIFGFYRVCHEKLVARAAPYQGGKIGEGPDWSRRQKRKRSGVWGTQNDSTAQEQTGLVERRTPNSLEVATIGLTTLMIS
jgi:hypothetical protein